MTGQRMLVRPRGESSRLFLVAIVLLLNVWSCAGDATKTRSTFRAAVYEHSIILPPDVLQTVSRSVAVTNMNRNLDVLDKQVKLAKQQNADIFLFSEDGIYGQDFSRAAIYPYLEEIPDPEKVTWSPCTDPTRFPNSEVQRRLSCAALHNSMYVVADMGDKVPCNHQTDPKCPKDGRYQYNTNVAYDPKGTLVARYHKRHLFFEDQFDVPDVEIRYFDTPFGRFGLIVCFDALFHDPAVSLVTNHNVTNILLPIAWPDYAPILTAMGFHSSFARRMGVNVLAANIHRPAFRYHGSGIYTPKGMTSFYRNSDKRSSGKLLVSDIQVLQKPSVLKSHRSKRGISHGNIAKAKAGEVVAKHRRSLVTNDPLFKTGKEFQSSILYDKYTLNVLQGRRNETRVCNGGVCCYVKYEIEESRSDPNFVFALGAFDGLHTAVVQFYMQNCALVKCKVRYGRYYCQDYSSFMDTKFKYMYLQGWFDTEHVFPQVLLTNSGKLELSKANEWTFSSSKETKTGKKGFVIESSGFTHSFETASLLGRFYDKD